jgi:hypothetical protein
MGHAFAFAPVCARESREIVVLSKVTLACFGALTALPHLALAGERAGPWSVAAADSLPTASIASICRDAQAAALPESKAAAYDSCVRDERAAFNELRQKWARYPAAARISCAEPSGVPVSYVELQTCLDMQSGGSLTREGPAPGGSPSLDTIPSPTPGGAEALPK